MRHHKRTKRFHRETNQRTAFMRSLAEALVTRGKITTTETRAKALRPYVEKLITEGKKGTLASTKNLVTRMGTSSRAKKLREVASKYADRKGGYTRIIKLANRKGDGSKMAVIEFV